MPNVIALTGIKNGDNPQHGSSSAHSPFCQPVTADGNCIRRLPTQNEAPNHKMPAATNTSIQRRRAGAIENR
ncbi:MAG: hypothetical protein A3H93_20335 [Rhodocyclales bacterium RIFCSPLOWO2_02_FULL_63_24]|nr:MAG: hypothetical protein A3H93_20335 [Rhodocyclales bacterium RIFCSPLOWO2_02_FULL_63_24]